MAAKRHDTFFYRNSLTLVFMLIFLLSLIGQMITGWQEYNQQLAEQGAPSVDYGQYLASGHFLQATFENWESEFLQMALFVILTIFLRQKGSSESKPLDEEEEVDKAPKPSPDAPWPVRKGGWWLKIYQHSLSIALIGMYLFSFAIHWYGSWKDYNEQQLLEHKATRSAIDHLFSSRLWFESFQNWQSEFLSVAAIIFLSIYLRQKGSPQSKPVDMPHHETSG